MWMAAVVRRKMKRLVHDHVHGSYVTEHLSNFWSRKIGPLQLEVTWYKIQNIGEQKIVPDSKTKHNFLKLEKRDFFSFTFPSTWSLVTFFCSPICWNLGFFLSRSHIGRDWGSSSKIWINPTKSEWLDSLHCSFVQ